MIDHLTARLVTLNIQLTAVPTTMITVRLRQHRLGKEERADARPRDGTRIYERKVLAFSNERGRKLVFLHVSIQKQHLISRTKYLGRFRRA